jgi:hypothetical protein
MKNNKPMKWESVKKALPFSESFPCAPTYYLINIDSYGWSKAMFIDNEWWSSYTNKVCVPVTHWMKVTNYGID